MWIMSSFLGRFFGPVLRTGGRLLNWARCGRRRPKVNTDGLFLRGKELVMTLYFLGKLACLKKELISKYGGGMSKKVFTGKPGPRWSMKKNFLDIFRWLMWGQ
jgi:hypothetical protein